MISMVNRPGHTLSYLSKSAHIHIIRSFEDRPLLPMNPNTTISYLRSTGYDLVVPIDKASSRSVNEKLRGESSSLTTRENKCSVQNEECRILRGLQIMV